MSDEGPLFLVGLAVASAVCALLPSTAVSGAEVKYAEKVCVSNEGVELIRGDSIRDGKVICNNGATFYYTWEDYKEN